MLSGLLARGKLPALAGPHLHNRRVRREISEPRIGGARDPNVIACCARRMVVRAGEESRASQPPVFFAAFGAISGLVQTKRPSQARCDLASILMG